MPYTKIYFWYLLLVPGILLLMAGCGDAPSDSDMSEKEMVSFPYAENSRISASDFLSDETFTELFVEVDYMEGYEPNAAALDSLEAFLESRLNKNSITVLPATEIPAMGRNAYTTNEIRNLEVEYRDTFTDAGENTLSAYLIILDGTFEQRDVVGTTYFYNSNAFFGPVLKELSGGADQFEEAIIQASVFMHEFGHLLGLVNTSDTNMQTNHLDSENGNHCDDRTCLMYYALERPEMAAQLVQDGIPSLDHNCVIDLQANGGK